MIVDKMNYGHIAVDKYLDVRYGDEKVFEYLGKDAYKVASNFIHEDYIEQFRKSFEQADTNWVGMHIKLRRYDGEYFDKYIEIKKHKQPVNNLQLWDIYIYDIPFLIRGYHEQFILNDSYKVLLELAGMDYFRYEHSSGTISLCQMLNTREVILFSMKLDEWKQNAVALGHIAEKDNSLFQSFCKDIASGRKNFSVDLACNLLYGSEEIAPCRIDVSTIYNKDKPWHTVGRISPLRASSSDISTGSIDALTKLFNKKAMTDKASALINETSDNVALFILDIDDFKDINDNYGHMFGDNVLSQIANVISDVIGENGFAGRIGGDEFMGVMTNFSDHAELKGRFRSIRSRIEFLFADIPGLNVTCSIGVCQKQANFENYETVFACADRCLYIAKDKGKNRYIIYTKELHGELLMDDGRITDLKGTPQTKDECTFTNEALEILYKEGYDGIEKVLAKFINELNFDRATVYYGDGLKRILYHENVESKFDYAFFGDNQEYINYFREDGLVVFTSTYRLEELDRDIYSKFTKQRTETFIQMLIGTKENVKGFISFEGCKHDKKIPQNIINCANIVAHAIARIIEETLD